jgi:predicted permease
VMPADFSFPQLFGLAFRPEIWTPLRFSPDEARTRGAGYMFLLLRRAADRSWPLVQEELDAMVREYSALEPHVYGGQQVRAIPLLDQIARPLRPWLFTVWASVVAVLLLACANVANLQLSRAAARQRELAVRASLGASRARLWRQLITESLVLTTLAAIAGWLLAFLLVQVGVSSLAEALPRAGEIAVDLRVAAFTATLALITCVLAGAVPALRLSSRAPEAALRNVPRSHTSSFASSAVGRTLLVAQIAIAVFVAACAGLLARSFLAMQRADIGIRPHGLVSFAIALPDAAYDRDAATAFYERLVDRLRQIPRVNAAGALSAMPLDGQDFSWTYEVRDKPAAPGTALDKADVRFVTAEALPALGATLRRGRWFERADQRRSEPVALVSESFARRTWPGLDPIDRYVKLAGPIAELPWMRVVGVVADVRFEAVDKEPEPAIYRPQAQHGWRHLTVVVRTDAPPAAIVPAVRTTLQAMEPGAGLLDPKGFSYYVERSAARRRLLTALVSSFAFIAVLLAVVGVHALFACMTALRTREIGVRLTLGATRQSVMWMVMREALVLAGLGLSLGVAAALAARRVLDALVFGISSRDVSTLVAVPAAVLLAAVLASYLPARRAATIDLTSALRPDQA